ncbi:Anaphase-promoting complex subunit 1 [Microbotryomycetes sp. JL221]|nr:Anaphase-promoting complex subunit 1 [Microbotryomycetes sp. JL221]
MPAGDEHASATSHALTDSNDDLDPLRPPPSPSSIEFDAVGEKSNDEGGSTPFALPKPSLPDSKQNREPPLLHSNGFDDGSAPCSSAEASSATEPSREDEGGGPGTFRVHHPERTKSDYSIHSAPELDMGHAGEEEVPIKENGSSEIRPSVTDVLAVEMDGEEGIKSERVTNFLTVPKELEQIIAFGVTICLDSFLYTFTILPLRVIVAFGHLVGNAYLNLIHPGQATRSHLRLSHKCDLTKAIILFVAFALLRRMTDASKMYHSVRGQDTIKLYVLFNVLEIADRLCCSFGQDLQDSLFSRAALGRRVDGTHPHIRPAALFGLNVAYVVAHTLVLFYQLVTLNVAINSYSNALLTLLLSNQFVEIKGSVFKKFEKENLFQLTCADMVERFQLSVMLFIIALRNLIELSSATSSSLFSLLPASFSLSFSMPSLPLLSLMQTIFSPAIIVLISECFVDWLKHAFITKFNHIRPAVYGRFIDVLCRDLIEGPGRRVDQLGRTQTNDRLRTATQQAAAEADEQLHMQSIVTLPQPRPPPAMSIASSSFLFAQQMMSLRSRQPMQDPGPASKASTSTSADRMSPTRTTVVPATQEYAETLDELSWTDSRVVWTRDGVVHRTLTFTQHLGQCVSWCLLANFKTRDDSEHNRDQRPIVEQSEDAGSNRASLGTFESKGRSVSAWTDEVLAVPLRPTEPRRAARAQFDRSLVVILKDTLLIYPTVGSVVSCVLPVDVTKAWALDVGIILERAERGQRHSTQPTLYYLRHPTEPIMAVQKHLDNSDMAVQHQHTLQASTFVNVWKDPFDKVLLATALGRGLPNIIVSYNAVSGAITMSSCRVKTGDWPTGAKGPANAKSSRDGQAHASDDLTNEHGKRLRSASHGKPKGSTVQQSNPLRDQRRLPLRATALSSTGHARPSAEASHMLDRSGDEIAMADQVLGKRINLHSSFLLPAADRRHSLTRHDLSVTMDRMALGSSSHHGQSRTSKIEIEQSESLAGLEHASLITESFHVDKQGHASLPSDAFVYGVDQDQATLVVHFASLSEAHLFKISFSHGTIKRVTCMGSHRALSACSACVRRRNVSDLVILGEDGQLKLVDAGESGGQGAYAIHLPLQAMNRAIRGDASRIESNGARHVVVVEYNGVRRHFSVDQFSSGTALQSLAALSRSLSASRFQLLEELESPTGWPAAAYELIDRLDLALQAQSVTCSSLNDRLGMRDALRAEIRSFVDQEFPNSTGIIEAEPFASSSRAKVARFNEDRRVEEAARMLQSSDPVTLAGERSLDQLTPNVQQNLLMALSNRTLALPVGRGMFGFGSETVASLVEAKTIKAINLSARLLPMPSITALVEKEGRDGHHKASRLVWPEFHNGVAAILETRLSVDSSRVPFCRVEELTPRYAGQLLGIGLLGHLGALGFNQAFEYLKVKHDPTSVAVLLGLSATYLGTSDPKVTSLLSVHLAALHPPQSSPLGVSGPIQAAGLVGIGLLNLATHRRGLADTMIRELESIKVVTIDDPSACREAYALSAGFACGMIMLGSGRNSQAIAREVQLLRTLQHLLYGSRTALEPTKAAATSANTDVSVTAAPATVALALVYLKSERADVAELLAVPDTRRKLDHVRPDLLILRTLARFLIMWDQISPTRQWAESCLPSFIHQAADASGKLVDHDLDIARWNILSGACLAIGFKFAGSASADAHSTLIHFVDRLARAAYVKAGNIQGRLKRQAIRACLSAATVALAMVMAGTGELNVLRRLRVAHGHFGEGVSFGVHMASHMALGLLLLGQGRFTLGTSDAAIAALLVSVYPVFPSTPTDNRTHLQALRHLWTIAVEARCLEARDVDTGEPVFLPVRLRMAETGTSEVRAKQLVAPTLIPDLRLIQSLQVDTPRYWPYSIEAGKDGRELASTLKQGFLWVKRKSGHLTYAQDPRGIRSIFTRSKGETGNAVIDFGETASKLSPSVTGLRDFVSSFSSDLEARAAVRFLCWSSRDTEQLQKEMGTIDQAGPSSFEAFCASVMLECLTRDKQRTISVYLQLFRAWHCARRLTGDGAALIAFEQFVTVLQWYAPSGAFATVFARSSKSGRRSSVPREALLQPAFVQHASWIVAQETLSNVQNDGNAQDEVDRLLRTAPQLTTTIGFKAAMYLLVHAPFNLATVARLRALASQMSQKSGRASIHQLGLWRSMLSAVRHDLTKDGWPSWSQAFEEDVSRVWLAG